MPIKKYSIYCNLFAVKATGVYKTQLHGRLGQGQILRVTVSMRLLDKKKKKEIYWKSVWKDLGTNRELYFPIYVLFLWIYLCHNLNKVQYSHRLLLGVLLFMLD